MISSYMIPSSWRKLVDKYNLHTYIRARVGWLVDLGFECTEVLSVFWQRRSFVDQNFFVYHSLLVGLVERASFHPFICVLIPS